MLPVRTEDEMRALCGAVADRLLGRCADDGAGRFDAFRGGAPAGLRRFVLRVACLGAPDVDPADAVLAALVLCERAPPPPPDAVRALFAVAHVVASKLLTELTEYLPMAAGAAHTGLGVRDFGRLEAAFLAGLVGYDVRVGREDFAAAARAVGWTDAAPA